MTSTQAWLWGVVAWLVVWSWLVGGCVLVLSSAEHAARMSATPKLMSLRSGGLVVLFAVLVGAVEVGLVVAWLVVCSWLIGECGLVLSSAEHAARMSETPKCHVAEVRWGHGAVRCVGCCGRGGLVVKVGGWLPVCMAA